MGSLFASLGTAGHALNVLEQAISVVQNNVSNANTPGYVTQTLQFAAQPFDASQNLWGGVEATGISSARDVYSEQSVRTAQQNAGHASQQASSLNALQGIFDVTGQSGVPKALSNLYSAFSSWSNTPADAAARQGVITAAQSLGQAFGDTYTQAEQLESNTGQQIQSAVSQLNQYASQVAQINGQIRAGSRQDAGLQAQLYNNLEEMSKLAPVSVNIESDGTATVLLGGQSPLVAGQTADPVSLQYAQPAGAVNPGASPSAQIVSSDGQDITALITSGSMGGALVFRNTTLPGILGDGQQQGSLNELAQAIADRVNTVLGGGQITAGPPAVSGVPLFSYNPALPTGIAGSLSVAPNMTGAQLAAIDPGPPLSANGIATKLASLANPQSPADMLNGFSYTQFYGNVAASVGSAASAAAANSSNETQILNQAQSLRAQVSGVSLNDQATQLLQFQNAYQASAQMITVINNMTQSLLQAFR